jgi:hypothetical protein
MAMLINPTSHFALSIKMIIAKTAMAQTIRMKRVNPFIAEFFPVIMLFKFI